MATSAGPLCEEPMWGVVLELEARLSALVSEQGGPRVELQEEVYGPFSGQVSGGWQDGSLNFEFKFEMLTGGV